VKNKIEPIREKGNRNNNIPRMNSRIRIMTTAAAEAEPTTRKERKAKNV
jgi:hypothetical protein